MLCGAQVYSACALVEAGAGAGSAGAGAVRGATCACVLERTRVCVGGEAGLALLDLERAELSTRRAHAPVAALAYVPAEQVLVCIAGRARAVRLVPLRALDCADVDSLKVPETKGALALAAGALGAAGGGGAHGFAVLWKRQSAHVVHVFEITRTAARWCRVAELRAPAAVLSVQLCAGSLVLGYRGGFAAHCLPHPHPHPRRTPADQPAICQYLAPTRRVTGTVSAQY